MKNVKIYFTKQNYIPFNLYISSLYNILLGNGFNVSVINNIIDVCIDTEFLILFLNDISDVYNFDARNTKVVFIHADYIKNHSKCDQEKISSYINIKNPKNTFIWEYNNLNMEYYRENYQNKKNWIYYLPLLYHSTLEHIYKSSVTSSIPYENKQFDILFMGSLQDRRLNVVNALKLKYNVQVIQRIDDIKQYVDAIENSKIVLNIYSSETNKPFDYYRLALLYSNKVMVINETIEHYNTDIEKNLIELKDVMIHADYTSIEVEIGRYLSMPSGKISEITEQIYNTFKKDNMNDYVENFFMSFN